MTDPTPPSTRPAVLALSAALHVLAPVVACAVAVWVRFEVLGVPAPAFGETLRAGRTCAWAWAFVLALRGWPIVTKALEKQAFVRTLGESLSAWGVVVAVLNEARGGSAYSRIALGLTAVGLAGIATAVHATLRRWLPADFTGVGRWSFTAPRAIARSTWRLAQDGRVGAWWLQLGAIAVPLVVAHLAMPLRAREHRAIGLQIVSGVTSDLVFACVVAALLVLARGRVLAAIAVVVTGFLAYANFEVFDSFGVQFGDDIAFILQPRNLGKGGALMGDAVRAVDLVGVGLVPLAIALGLLWLGLRLAPRAPSWRMRAGHVLVLAVFAAAAIVGRNTARRQLQGRPGAIGASFFADDLPVRLARLLTPSKSEAWGETAEARVALAGLRPTLPGVVAPDDLNPFFHVLPRDLCRYGAPPSFAVSECGKDKDGDGFTLHEDCEDSDPAIHPGAIDVPGNRVDEDCDGRDARRRNLAIVHVESLGAFDVQPLTDLFADVTPGLARLSSEGVTFTNAFSNEEPSDQARSAYLIGSLGMDPAAIDKWTPVEGPTLPDVLRAAGYRTSTVLGAPLDFQGMARFFAVHPLTDAIGRERLRVEGLAPLPWTLATTDFITYADEQIYGRSLEWIEASRKADPNAPWALFIASGSSHWPFPSPPDLATFESPQGPRDAMVDVRHRSVKYADRELVKFVEALRAAPDAADTTIVIFGDHPPANMLPEAIDGIDKPLSQRWIPLVFLNAPELGAAGTRVEDVASLVDLPSTLMDLIGSREPNAFAGRSLVRPATGPAACAVVTKGGSAFVCPGLVCDRRFGDRPCRARPRGAYVGDDVPLPSFGFGWAEAAVAYDVHLMHDLGRLTPGWFHGEAWNRDHHIGAAEPLALGKP